MSARGGKKRVKFVSKSTRAGVLFPVGRMHRYLKKVSVKYRIGAGAPVYLAAVIEYLTAEILELAGNAARDNRRARITPRHILLAIANDMELHMLLKNVTIPSGGVLPHIYPELLTKKSSKGKPVFDHPNQNVAPPKVRTVAAKKQLPPKKLLTKALAKGNIGGSPAKGKAGAKTVLSEKKLFLGQKLTVIQGDISDVTVDCVVNPTNGSFFLGGEVGSALERAGGKEFTDEVDKLYKAHGSLELAGAAICPGHKFPAKFVIHCHSPTWGSASAIPNLEKCIKNCLALADEKNLNTIAIPAVSSGKAGMPKQTAAETVLRAIKNYFVSVMASSLKQVYFVLYDKESVNVYISELSKLDVDH
ncbi:Core histone macro-H2A.1 [Holothuria leucospilota]|uniref:Core histone macro-H2A.1 n=1 Tax=Holothuria leucospilota TaxID=206669 RepID=A0A9Q1BF79_HOLLE|nr:Core histone macro-H2A.1 [Holothuria leucospilota]